MKLKPRTIARLTLNFPNAFQRFRAALHVFQVVAIAMNTFRIEADAVVANGIGALRGDAIDGDHIFLLLGPERTVFLHFGLPKVVPPCK